MNLCLTLINMLYNLILLFGLNFVISCHAQLATLACAKMRAVWWGKSSEKPWQKNIGFPRGNIRDKIELHHAGKSLCR